jgi:ribosomal protein S18 acetylase RimI-like enzyme
MRIEIKRMEAQDISRVTAIHIEAFPSFFLSFLGHRFLSELYAAILADDEGLALVARQGENIVGFVAGSRNGSGFYRRAARQRWSRFALASIAGVIRRPRIVRRLTRALYSPPKSSIEGALLMSLAVDPLVRRSGAGTLLVNAFLEEAAIAGTRIVTLTTDQMGNDAVNAFYRARGFNLARGFTTPEGRLMNEYIFNMRMEGP